MSLPVRGAWIEMCVFSILLFTFVRSLPVRGAWIEICNRVFPNPRCQSLPVRGAWIEISDEPRAALLEYCRSPCGERGLKYR
mgnify:CR=1 FL=1